MTLPTLNFALVPAADGNQRISDPAGETPLPTPPPVVESLAVADVTAYSVTVTWAYVSTKHTGFRTEYQRVGQDGDWVTGATLQPESRSWILQGLAAETGVNIRVIAFNDVGDSAPAAVSQTTLPGNIETDLNQILVYENMSNVPIGESWSGHVPFGASITIGSQEVTPLTSDRVGMNEMLEGAEGYGRWGFDYMQGLSAREGDEVWFRVYYLMPVGYDHYSYGEGNRLKWFRMGCAQIIGGHTTGTNGISLDFKESSRWLHYKEQPTDTDMPGYEYWNPIGTFDGSKLYADGNWHSYEYYILHSKDPTIGHVRYWIDGKLMGTVTRATLTDPVKAGTEANGPYHCNRLYFQTYWNGGSPKTQRAYFDNVAIAVKIAGVRDDTPYLAVDETGYPYIGSTVQ